MSARSASDGSSGADSPPGSARARNLTHVQPADVPLQAALDAVADPVRRAILCELAGEPDWTRACGTFDLPVGKATRSHHFAVLRRAGLIEQRDAGPRRVNRLRRPEFDQAFPGLLDLVLKETPPTGG
ncbi:helix-turn-helix transcriptional regulator [Streptosporangium canum]|uniref:ArsR/SmtB family transcription factor n=1 Tax=Streptosporangium canum TaxID=324952 RepID=UPI003432B551